MSAAPVFLETFLCNWCSKHRPRFRAHRLASNQVICDDCLAWHFHALEVLGGAPPTGCQHCGAAWRQLQEREPGAQVRMYVVPKDGVHQLLCRDCVKPYTQKRGDLYKGTKFGSETLKL